MAKNRKYEQGNRPVLDVSAVNGSGTGDLVLSGDPVAVGDIPGVALVDEDADGLATVQTDGVFELTVTGLDATPANAAISPGDIIFWDDAAGQLNVDATNGVRFGYALGAVAGGASTAIDVKVGY